MTTEPGDHERLQEAVRTRRQRRELWQQEGERSLGQNLAMIGTLGWTIVLPVLVGIFAGRWLDKHFGTGVFWTLGLLVVGLAAGCTLAWQTRRMRPIILVMGATGFGLGLTYFAALRRTIVILAMRRGWLGPLSLTLARLAAVGLFLAVAAKLAAAALIAGFVGFLLARTVAVRAANRGG